MPRRERAPMYSSFRNRAAIEASVCSFLFRMFGETRRNGDVRVSVIAWARLRLFTAFFVFSRKRFTSSSRQKTEKRLTGASPASSERCEATALFRAPLEWRRGYVRRVSGSQCRGRLILFVKARVRSRGRTCRASPFPLIAFGSGPRPASNARHSLFPVPPKSARRAGISLSHLERARPPERAP